MRTRTDLQAQSGNVSMTRRAAGNELYCVAPDVNLMAGRLPGDILQLDSKSTLKSRARFSDLPEKLWMVFKPVIEPIIFRFEADQDSCCPPMPGNDDLFAGRQPQVFRQIVFNGCQSDLPRCASLPYQATPELLFFR